MGLVLRWSGRSSSFGKLQLTLTYLGGANDIERGRMHPMESYNNWELSKAGISPVALSFFDQLNYLPQVGFSVSADWETSGRRQAGRLDWALRLACQARQPDGDRPNIGECICHRSRPST